MGHKTRRIVIMVKKVKGGRWLWWWWWWWRFSCSWCDEVDEACIDVADVIVVAVVSNKIKVIVIGDGKERFVLGERGVL